MNYHLTRAWLKQSTPTSRISFFSSHPPLVSSRPSEKIHSGFYRSDLRAFRIFSRPRDFLMTHEARTATFEQFFSFLTICMSYLTRRCLDFLGCLRLCVLTLIYLLVYFCWRHWLCFEFLSPSFIGFLLATGVWKLPWEYGYEESCHGRPMHFWLSSSWTCAFGSSCFQ